MKNDIFWSEVGSGFEKPDGIPPPRIPRTLPGGLNPHKSSGPDHLPPRVLKECTIEIAPNFCSLLNRSFFAGEIPNAWKIANSVPVLERTC